MRDSLKEHIENSREDFELYPFDGDQEWSKLSNKIQPKKKPNVWRISSIAACVALVITGSIFYMSESQTVDNPIAEIESFYEGEINQKVSLIKGQLTDDRVLDDLEEMDAAFAELKADLDDNVDNEEVITAMMENYRLKLQILEEILNELEKVEREEVL